MTLRSRRVLVNSWSEFVPGHVHLAGYVKEGIRDAGGTPMEFNTVAACDGIAQGEGMHYILPLRDALVVSSSGNAQAQILQEFPFYEPRTNITTGGFSTMGFTLPAALGAKLARPERPVVGIAGDGDFLMTVHELATAVQYGIPVVVLVLNNMGWQSINDLQVAAYGEDRRIGCDFLGPDGSPVSPDFKAIAEGFGCYAERISKASEVKLALGRAFDSGRPAVVEVMVNKEFPYSGGIAVGWWDVPVPAYLKERREEYERARAEEVL